MMKMWYALWYDTAGILLLLKLNAFIGWKMAKDKGQNV